MDKSRKIFVGDLVRTPAGDGYVEDAQSWREKIVDMGEWEAKEFSDRCRVESGLNYQEDWVEILVKVGGHYKRYLGHQIQVLESRYNGRK